MLPTLTFAMNALVVTNTCICKLVNPDMVDNGMGSMKHQTGKAFLGLESIRRREDVGLHVCGL